MLPALKIHQAGQEAVGDVDIIAKVALHLVSHCAQPKGQLLRLNGVQLCLVPLQALQLPAERKDRRSSSAKSGCGCTTPAPENPGIKGSRA